MKVNKNKIKTLILVLSVVLNLIFIILFTVIGIKYRESLIRKFLISQKQAEIVMFGDSITEWGKWNELLRRNDVKNSGFGGFTTSHFNWLIEEHVVGYSPKYCFIQGGINDIGVGIPLERTKANYKRLIKRMVSAGIIPIVQSTFYQVNRPHRKAVIDELNEFLKSYCESTAIEYLDVNSKLSTDTGLKPEYSSDGTHINYNAYVIWAEEIAVILRELEKKEE